ncbi:MAG: tail fiber domain-containing protein [Gammaproteobacteria bacterium]|nr:tail fiber domain-containing protein [Gammaproteobacteria bacterium]
MGCFGGSTPTADTTVQDTMSELSRLDFEDFKKNYEHLAGELVHASNSDDVIRDNVATAVSRVDPAFESSKGQVTRQASRYNTNLNNSQRQLLLKQHDQNKALATVDVANRARDSSADLQDQLRGDVVALGQGQKDTAMGDYSTAAGLESNRNTTNINNQAQHKASIAGLAGQVAGLGASALILSSKKAKKNVKGADAAEATKEVRQLKVKNYQYKNGKGPEGERTGVIAEDSPQVATPDGSKVNLGDWTGKLTLALQDVAEKVDGIDGRILKLEKAVG